jgi:hypothetical protein
MAFALQPSQVSLNGVTLDVNGGSYYTSDDCHLLRHLQDGKCRMMPVIAGRRPARHWHYTCCYNRRRDRLHHTVPVAGRTTVQLLRATALMDGSDIRRAEIVISGSRAFWLAARAAVLHDPLAKAYFKQCKSRGLDYNECIKRVARRMSYSLLPADVWSRLRPNHCRAGIRKRQEQWQTQTVTARSIGVIRGCAVQRFL